MPRPSDKPVTLGELMGNQDGELRLSNLSELLGEKMPELPRDSVGRFRLMRALKNRLGDGFRNLPGVKNLIKEFDSEVNLKRLIAANRRR